MSPADFPLVMCEGGEGGEMREAACVSEEGTDAGGMRAVLGSLPPPLRINNKLPGCSLHGWSQSVRATHSPLEITAKTFLINIWNVRERRS